MFSFDSAKQILDTGCRMLDGRSARLAFIAAGVLTFAALALHAQEPAKKNSYDNFKMVQARNIFDPDRSRDRASETPRPVTRQYTPTPPPVQKTDYVELTGVMTTEQETFAFFAGSQPDYNKVLAVNGSIAGATITRITSGGVEVKRNGRQITVPVGLTVPLDDIATPGLPPAAGGTTVVTTTEAAATGSATTSSVDPKAASQQVPLPDATGTSTTSAPQPGESNIDAIRRKLEERRQKELNQ